MLPLTSKKGGRDKGYGPSHSLEDSGQRGVNIDGVRYEVKVTGQAYSQAKVIAAPASIDENGQRGVIIDGVR